MTRARASTPVLPPSFLQMDACGHTLLDAFTTHAEDARCGGGRLVHAEPAFGGRIDAPGRLVARAPAEEAWACGSRGGCSRPRALLPRRVPPRPERRERVRRPVAAAAGRAARLTLIDFGMARLLSGGGDAAAGAGGGVGDLCVLGKLAYLAPGSRGKVAAGRAPPLRPRPGGGRAARPARSRRTNPADVEAARVRALGGAKADA